MIKQIYSSALDWPGCAILLIEIQRSNQVRKLTPMFSLWNVENEMKTGGRDSWRDGFLCCLFLSATSVYSPALSQGQLSSPACYQCGFWWNSADNRVLRKDGRKREIKNCWLSNNYCTFSTQKQIYFSPLTYHIAFNTLKATGSGGGFIGLLVWK